MTKKIEVEQEYDVGLPRELSNNLYNDERVVLINEYLDILREKKLLKTPTRNIFDKFIDIYSICREITKVNRNDISNFSYRKDFVLMTSFKDETGIIPLIFNLFTDAEYIIVPSPNFYIKEELSKLLTPLDRHNFHYTNFSPNYETSSINNFMSNIKVPVLYQVSINETPINEWLKYTLWVFSLNTHIKEVDNINIKLNNFNSYSTQLNNKIYKKINTLWLPF